MQAASAGTPQLGTLLQKLESLNKPASAVAKAATASARLQDFKVPASMECCGDLHIGVFFDGTGNNKEEDYGPENNPKLFWSVAAHESVGWGEFMSPRTKKQGMYDH